LGKDLPSKKMNSQSNNQDISPHEIRHEFDQRQLSCQVSIQRYFHSAQTFSFSFPLTCFKLPKSSKVTKKYHPNDLRNSQHMVRFCLSEIFERQLGLENPVRLGLYCTVIRNISESKCVLLPVLTSYSVMATCYDRVGAEYNNCLTVNNARRLVLHGFLTTRSPKQAMAKVLL
jgi:hypothetical protein